MFPRLVIDTKKIAKNVQVVTSLCADYNLDVIGITKGVCGDKMIAQIFAENGVSALGDSRVQNLKKIADIKAQKWLIRTPQISELDDVVTYADISLNSELKTIESLEKACQHNNIKKHGIVLLYDLGDLRDGFVEKADLIAAAQRIQKLPHLYLAGIACNLTCLSFVKASVEKLQLLVDLAEELKAVLNCDDLLISGGNSATLQLLLKGDVPAGINNLRLGESLLIGRERDSYTYLPDTFKDTFILQAEIVEIKEKPSLPWGEINTDSFGNRPQFKDYGKQYRAVLAVGNQDCAPGVMTALDESVHIIGDSCDHLICKLDNPHKYEVGDVVDFYCGYHALLHALTSEYVEKVYV